MVDASVGFHCPECVRTGSGTGHRPDATRPRTIAGGAVAADPHLVTKVLIGINLAVFLAARIVGERFLEPLVLVGQWPPYPFVATEGIAEGEPYRLVTSMFLHWEIWHVFFNMLMLWWLGGPLEQALGRVRYLALFLVSGLAGSALTYLIAAPEQSSLGASGAVYGLLGATVVLMRRMSYDLRPIMVLLAINLFITFYWDGIAWQAHIGGLVAGVAIAYGLVHAPPGRRRNTVQFATCALVLLAAVAAVVARTASIA
jgi:membrane associated rhomboid family serine protease